MRREIIKDDEMIEMTGEKTSRISKPKHSLLRVAGDSDHDRKRQTDHCLLLALPCH